MGNTSNGHRQSNHRLEWTRHVGRCSGLSMRAKAAAWALAIFMSPEGISPSRADQQAPSLETIGVVMGSVTRSTAQRGIYDLEGRDWRKPKEPAIERVWLSHLEGGGKGRTSSYRALIPVHPCARIGGQTWSPVHPNVVTRAPNVVTGESHRSTSPLEVESFDPTAAFVDGASTWAEHIAARSQ